VQLRFQKEEIICKKLSMINQTKVQARLQKEDIICKEKRIYNQPFMNFFTIHINQVQKGEKPVY
jgi:hypothetical protein